MDPVPWSPLRRPLNECRVALVTSGGFTQPGQPPFDEGIKGGDPSVRVIEGGADPRVLIETHRSESFDHRGIGEDANLAFPLDRLRELVACGRVGSANRRHLSFMGSLTAPGRFARETWPQAAELLVEDAVDVALLVPV